MSDSPYHTSVLLQECLDGLAIRPDGIYVDLTFGGGGHSKAILKALGPEGRLIAFDQDEDAWKQAEAIQDPRFELIQSNFKHMEKYLRLKGVAAVDGMLADFGVSSHQLDAAERGFSTRFDGPLDMRMSAQMPLTAADVLNTYTPEQLQAMFGRYGEIKNARSLAQEIVQQRHLKLLESTEDFKNILLKLAPKFKEFKYFAQAFQAVRIEVNQELAAIETWLEQVPKLLKPEGRLCVISFHSLEDRLVKYFIKTGNVQGIEDKDMFGRVHKPLQAIHRKAVQASEAEMALNNRARSAKLRVAYKL